jgi:PAS domain S-box-containing protein
MRLSCVAAALLLVLLPTSSLAATTKNVLIVRGEAPDLPGPTILVDQVEKTIRASVAGPVEFYVEVFDTGRLGADVYDESLGALLAAKYADVRIDLIVAFSQPAVQFMLRERPVMFPSTPVLAGLVDQRLFDEHALPPNASVVYVRIDAKETIKFAQRVYPTARRVLVAGGTSQFDRGWQRAVREDLRGLETTVPIAYDVDSSLDDLTRRVSVLPPDTIVLYVSMTRDGADQIVRPTDAVARLRSAASVPVFGVASTNLGQGVVGGAVIDFTRHGADLGRQAVRMLAGDVPPPTTTPTALMADWRELQRFHVDESGLPASTVVAFREPSLWDEEKGTILSASAVVIAQSALIIALVRAGSRRRETERRLLERLRFEQQLSEFSVSLATVRPGEISSAIEPALERMAAGFGVDWAWRWRNDEPEDTAWQSAPLRAGDPASFTDIHQLPPTVQRHLQHLGATSCSALAMPMSANGTCFGAIFWISREPGYDWPAQTDHLRVVGAVVATVLQRKLVEIALEDSHYLKGAILDSLPSHIAVLDRSGIIIAVNDAWSRFARDNDVRSADTLTPGASYLRACNEAIRYGDVVAEQAVALIERACRGQRNGVQLEYRCDGPDSDRWFVMTAEPLRRPEGGAVVTHIDITARKQSENALRESEDRFRRLADGLPVAVWMADAAGGCTYCNQGWIDLTGHAIEQHRGDGWLQSVHPGDRAECMEAYLRAVHDRETFRAEFRVVRYDGSSRWLTSTGVPRYGSDGSFHGYVGGCLDITDRKEAEDVLRGLSHRLMTAQDDERRRIARELHDHLSQQLALLAIDLQQLSMQPPISPDALVPALHEAWRRTTEIASDVHAISHRLHPSKMEALGLVATVRAHCREVSRQALVVEFVDQNVPSGVPPERALALFRVLEEALSNVVRHSRARGAQVALAGAEGELLLRVADDGRGFELHERQEDHGLGLISMRERVQALDGTLSITSIPGRGTVVEARVPLAPSTRPFGSGTSAISARAESA